MKKVNFKKLLLLLIIIAIVVCGIIFIIKGKSEGSKITTEEKERLSSISLNYVINLTKGYGTEFGGKDLLFESDKTTTEDISAGSLIMTGISYATQNNLNTSINSTLLDEYCKNNDINKSEYSFYNGEAVKEGIKKVFGIDFNNTAVLDDFGFGYDILYNQDNDFYLIKKNDTYVKHDKNYQLIVQEIETTTKKKELKVNIAVAYSYYNGKEYQIASDSKFEKIVIKSEEGITEIPKDKIDSFNKYTITYKVDKDNYTFESIEKNK